MKIKNQSTFDREIPVLAMGIFTLLILSISSIIDVPILATSVGVTLLPGAAPTFFKCGITSPYVGADSLRGMTVNQSINAVFADPSANTWVAGKASFDVFLGSIVIVNEPGPDLAVHEIGGPESFEMAVFDPSNGNFSAFKMISVGPTAKVNSCNQTINSANIDLSIFGIRNGSSVSLLRFDNIGEHGCCYGADITGIIPIHWKEIAINNASQTKP